MNPYSKWIGLAFLWVMMTVASGQLPSDPVEYKTWETRALSRIESDRAEKDMNGLARWVFNMRSPMKREPEPRPVYRAACDALISFPDHVEYFRKSLEAAIALELAEAGGAPRTISDDFERPHLFQIMEELRSPNIVGLLGEMLEDERNPWKDTPRSDVGFPATNATYATQALTHLGIDGLPEISLKGMQNRAAAKEQWKLWFAQVKAGTRTFRFKDDPQEYNLQGPVGAPLAKVPDTSLSRLTSKTPAPPSPSPKEAAGYHWLWWVGLAIFLPLLGVYEWKRRAKRG